MYIKLCRDHGVPGVPHRTARQRNTTDATQRECRRFAVPSRLTDVMDLDCTVEYSAYKALGQQEQRT